MDLTDPESQHPVDEYTPTISAEQAERVRQWHENAHAAAKAGGSSNRTVSYLGTTLVVPPEVQPINPVSHLLGKAVLAEVDETDRVLDMGTGSGVNAILAASVAREVVAVDVNPRAVEAAGENVERNGVSNRVTVRHSDVFSAVTGGFDLIVLDPPFRWFAPRDLLEVATADENYRALTTFFRNARRYLTDQGRMLIFFGTSGDLGYLTRLFEQESFDSEVVAHEALDKDGWRVDYYTYLLTP
ncbi:release factor glutamine methyltransferase [Saccharopolyspora lacisalsi]|uniref:Release factor glutamine methyltransferase n=1 Tax=Halosaccharopolyspora lacisalsi TaxID=1000566 RepID=A0A839E1U4_9PSEU|nr:methyltransferase [Halosaccharopolyspora lacisalsi]MBA8824918.1 release factor glutamine methyltransferase [Halosaccharopolyspora lacisalsi]